MNYQWGINKKPFVQNIKKIIRHMAVPTPSLLCILIQQNHDPCTSIMKEFCGMYLCTTRSVIQSVL